MRHRPPARPPLQVPRDGGPQPLRRGPCSRPGATTSSMSAIRPTSPRRSSCCRLVGRRGPRTSTGSSGSARSGAPSGALYYRACAWLAARPADPCRDRRARHPGSLPRAYGRETDYFPYGDRPRAGRRTTGRSREIGLHRARTCSTSAGSNRRTMRTSSSRHISDVTTALPLVIVGDAPYAGAYIDGLHARPTTRVRFLGAVYGRGYPVLQLERAAYVQATEVGGTHPALVEAMGHGNGDRRQRRARASGGPRRRRSVLRRSSAGLARRPSRRSLDDPAGRTGTSVAAAQARARGAERWDSRCDRLRALVQGLLGPSAMTPRRPETQYTRRDDQGGADHRDHWPGRLVPRRTAARAGLPRPRDDPASEHRRRRSPARTRAWSATAHALPEIVADVSLIRDLTGWLPRIGLDRTRADILAAAVSAARS